MVREATRITTCTSFAPRRCDSNTRKGCYADGDTSIFQRLAGDAILRGITKFTLEYNSGTEHLFAKEGNLGIGIASLKSSSAEAEKLRMELYASRKGKVITLNGQSWKLRVRIFESFGEDAFSIEVRPVRSAEPGKPRFTEKQGQ